MPDAPTRDFEFGGAIPVVRMLDEQITRDYYVGFLGFAIDWEHRFQDSADSPLYLQVSLGKAVVHLNGHASATDPVCEFRIPVRDLEGYCESLRGKDVPFEKPETVDVRETGTKQDMPLRDPSGNLIIFWLEE